MDRLLFPADVAERYHCSLPTARRYIKSALHQERPLAITETALMDWERSRTVQGGTTKKAGRKYQYYQQAATDTFKVPRRRPA